MATVVQSQKAINKDTGEMLIVETVARRPGQVIKVVNPVVRETDTASQSREQKHIKLKTAREQKRLYKSLKPDEKAFLFSLLPYMDWETNILVGDGEDGENGAPLRWSQIEKIAGISKPTRLKLVRVLEDMRIIGYMMVGQKKVGIVINPDYAIYGRIPQDALVKVFQVNKDIDDD